MKAWGWISMRRSLEDAMNKAFEENHNEECANWPILEFQMKKRSSKLESTRKTEQDRPCRKFWLLVKGQRKKSKSTILGQSQRILVRVGSGFPGRVTGRAVEPMTSSYDVSLTWTRADVDVLAWLLTWSDDVIRWRQMTSAADFGAWQERTCSLARGGEVRNPGGAWRRVRQCLTTRFSGQVNRWTRRPSWRRVYTNTIWKSRVWGGAW